MALESINPSGTHAWQNLRKHFEDMQYVSMQELFQKDGKRAETFHIQWNDFLVDYSKNLITKETMEYLLNLTQEVDLKEAISKYFEGDIINKT
jgi:glucose-6-phosphate isomerase